MADRGPTRIKDRHLPWEGPFPYETLSARLVERGRPPIGPSTPSTTVLDALYDLALGGKSDDEARAIRLAWDELRNPTRRLVVDFFMYEVDPSEADAALAEIASLPVPSFEPDFRKLADIPFRCTEVPARETAPLPSPGVPSAAGSVANPDLDVIDVDLIELLGSQS